MMNIFADNTEPIWHTPPSGITLENDVVHVWRVLLEAPLNIYHSLRETLSPEEVQYAQRFRFEKEQKHWIITHGVLRKLLGQYLHTKPQNIQFTKNTYGKPSILSPEFGTHVYFNLSHSNTIALFAFALDRQVGVDVEYTRIDMYDDALAKYCFSSNEYDMLCSLPEAQRKKAFFLCWTRKEAYIKAKGKGLTIPLKQFDVSLTPGEPAVLLASREDDPAIIHWSLHALEPGNDYVGAFAIEGSVQQHYWWQWQHETPL